VVETYKQLEQKYKKFVGANYAVSCNTGTSALHLALLALGVGKGDEVIIPDFTMAACGFAISYTGATPVFIDCSDDLNIDTKLIEAKITPKTRAIMGVDIYGRLCNWKEIHRIAKKHKLKVIEDAAECQLPKEVYKSKADITCYSFYQNKIIHAEEGGMCTTDNKKYANRINFLKNMAFGDRHDYFHTEIGYNYRMPNSQAKLALQSLKDYPKENKRRRKIEFDYYGENKLDAVWVLPYLGRQIDGKDNRPFFKPLSTFPMYGGKCQSPKALYYSKLGHYIKL
jgi:dTDP-4-amino-4,6-dideoxygalactose transaminase